MTVTYIWSITNLSVFNFDNYQDAVHEATWKVVGDDGVSQAEATGVVVFSIPTDSFIPYSELTESTVLNWTKASLGEVRVAEAENSVYAQLAATRYSDKPLPWNQPKATPSASTDSQEETPTEGK